MSHRMIRSALFTALLALSAPLLAQSPAPPPASAVPSDPYQTAMASILASADDNVFIDNFIRTFAAQMPKSDARIAALEAQRPGLALAIAESLRPTLVPYSQRVTADYRVKVLATMREVFTPDDARTLTIVFSAPAMKKFMRLIVANTAQTNAVRDSLSGSGAVTAAALEADEEAAVNAAMKQLTAADFAELAKLPMTPELGRKMERLTARLGAIRLELENAEMLPEERRAVEDAVEAAIVKFLASEK